MAASGGSSGVVARWSVPLGGKVHEIEFEHGPIVSGKRVVRVDGRVVLRREFMFHLIGQETFRVDNTKCKITIDNGQSFDFAYTLEVNGKPFKRFVESVKRGTRTWLPWVEGERRRVVLEMDKMAVYVDGRPVDTAGEFAADEEDDGTSTHFIIGKQTCQIKTISSGDRFQGLVHSLYVGDKLIEHEEDWAKMAMKVRDPRTPE